VLQMAINEGPGGPAGDKPERRYAAVERTAAVPVGVVAGGILAGAGLWWALRRKKPSRNRALS